MRPDPLLRVVAGLVAGLTLAHAWPDPHAVAPILAGGGAMLTILAIGLRRHRPAPVVGGAGLALLLWVVHGGLAPPPAEVAAIPHHRTLVIGTIHGLVEHSLGEREERTRFLLQTEEIDGVPVHTRVRTTLYGALPAPVLPGDRLRVDALVRPPRAYKDPGAFDFRRWLAREGVHWQTGLPAERMVVVGHGSDYSPLRALQRLRDRRAAELRARFSPTTAALVTALTLGIRDGLTPAVRQTFIDSGTAHLLAISGLHVGLLATYLFALTHLAARRTLPLAALRDGRPWAHPQAIAAAVALTGVATYTLMSGAHTSTRRAAVMIVALLVAPLLGRRSRPGHALAMAALLLLCLRPEAVGLASFQLSFAAVAGILVALGRREGAAAAPWQRRVVQRGTAWATGLIRASVGAWLATAPFVWWHFGQVAPAGLVVNLPAIPLVGLALLPCCFLSLVIPHGVPVVGPLVTAATDGAARAMMALASLGAGWPAGHLRPPPPSLPLLVAGAAATALVAAALYWRRRHAPARLVAVAGVGLVAAVVVLAMHRPPTGAEVVVLDVGQGDSVLLRTAHGRTVLVDGGGTSLGDLDVGAAVVVPALRSLGVDHLDVVALTHPQADHMGGLFAVLESLPVGTLWDPWREPVSRAHGRLHRLAAARHIPIEHPVEGFEYELDGARLHCLHPLRPPLPDRDPNDGSLVLMVDLGERRLLLTGDIDRRIEQRLVARHGAALACDLLKLAHHGSRTSSSTPFLRATHPATVLISVGETSPFGHPHPTTLERIARLLPDTRTWRTDLDGQLRVALSPEIRVEPHPAPGWVRRWRLAE